MGESRRERAVIIGGSMAGLLAGRVLADHFKKVIILERDPLPENGDHRRGVPHGRHAHALLAGGLQAVEGMLPGITNELVAHGALAADPANDGIWFFEGKPLQRTPLGVMAVLLSRPFLESTIRRRVAGFQNIEIRSNVSVRNLRVEKTRVTGLVTDNEEVDADLVVMLQGAARKAQNGSSRPVSKNPSKKKSRCSSSIRHVYSVAARTT